MRPTPHCRPIHHCRMSIGAALLLSVALFLPTAATAKPPTSPVNLTSRQHAQVTRLADVKLRGRIAKPNVAIFLPRSFTAPTSLMSKSVWINPRATPLIGR